MREPKDTRGPLPKGRAALANVLSLGRLVWETDHWRCLAAVTLRSISATLPLVTLWLAKLIIDEVAALPVTHNPWPVWSLLGVEAILLLATDILSRALSTTEAVLGERFSHHLVTLVLRQANQLDLESLEDPVFHDKLERARAQANARLGVLSSVAQSIQQLVTVASLFLAALALAPWIALAQVLSVMPVIVSETHFTKFWHRLYREQTPRRREIDYALLLATSPASAKEVRAFRLSSMLESWVEQVGVELWRRNADLTTRRNRVGAGLNIVGLVAYYAGYAYIVWRATAGMASIGDVILLAGLLQRTRTSVQGTFSLLARSAEQAVLLGELFDLLRLKPRLTQAVPCLPGPRNARSGLAVEHVSFSYAGSPQLALDDCTFRMELGTRLALVGANGSGKSTLVKLITRMYDPTAGRILLDGVDLREYDADSLRRQIAPVFQDFVRYDLTIRQNVGFGRIEAQDHDGDLWEALNAAKAARLVESMPDGLDQMLGKRFQGGIELSGGQWQALAIARAWLSRAKLVILDEPTAAIDAKAEQELLATLATLTEGRMALLISHRFSTVRIADHIVVLSRGRVAETGTHEVLVSRGGEYAEMFELQASGYR